MTANRQRILFIGTNAFFISDYAIILRVTVISDFTLFKRYDFDIWALLIATADQFDCPQ